jgi:hypothetical protein
MKTWRSFVFGMFFGAAIFANAVLWGYIIGTHLHVWWQ